MISAWCSPSAVACSQQALADIYAAHVLQAIVASMLMAAHVLQTADSDHDGLILVDDFVPVYRAIATARQAFKHQDHHHNGQIDR